MITLGRLREGDMIRNLGSGEAYIVVQTDPDIIAVRTVTVTNAPEWVQLTRAELLPGLHEVPDDDYNGPWFSGWVTCTACGQTHMSVHPASCVRVECPKCGYMTDAPVIVPERNRDR